MVEGMAFHRTASGSIDQQGPAREPRHTFPSGISPPFASDALFVQTTTARFLKASRPGTAPDLTIKGESLVAYEDKTITCVDCGTEFIHSADDQARYAERGFTNEPKRCRECREKRKAQGGGGGGHGRGSYDGGGGGGGYGARESHTVTCADCGVQTTVPFKPTGDRPVYCRDCFRAHRN